MARIPAAAAKDLSLPSAKTSPGQGVQGGGAGAGLPGLLPGGPSRQHQRVPVQPVHHQDD